MSAPRSKYSNDTINDKDSGNDKQILVLQPLALMEYLPAYDAGKTWSQMTDAEKKDDSGFKQKFFCHDVWHRQDTEGKECVIGLLDTRAGITNSHYQDLHAEGRKGKLRLTKGGVNYTVLNDGGLNTKAFIGFTSGTGSSPIVLATPDVLAFNVSYRNAYYANTTKFQCTISASGHGTRTFTMQDIPLGAKGASSLFTYLGTEISAMALPENTNITIQLTAINPEGAYTTTTINATLGARVTLWPIYLVENETDDWDDGVMYYIILDEEWWNYSASDPDSSHNLGWLLAQSADVTHTANDTTIRGQQGSDIGSDVLDGVLPSGMYLNIPDGYIETPTQEDPPGSSNIIWIDANGHPYKWKALPTPPAPSEDASWASTNPIVISIGATGSYTSYATPADGLNDRTAYIYPILTVRCADKGTAFISIKCSVVDHSDYSNVLVSKTKDLDVKFTENDQTKTIPIVEDAGEETTFNLRAFALPFTPSQQISRYDIVLEVTSADPALATYPDATGEIESDGTITTT